MITGSNSEVAPPPGIGPASVTRGHAIVLRVPNWIGDAVLALPAIAAITKRFAAHPIVILTRTRIAPLFEGMEGIHAIVRLRGRRSGRFSEARAGLAPFEPAAGVLFAHSLGTALELKVAGVPETWGYGGWLHRAVVSTRLAHRWRRGCHRWESYAVLAAAFTGRPVAERYPLPSRPEDGDAALQLLRPGREARPLIGMVAGASALSRRWPAERFAVVASRLGREGARVVLFGSSADRSLTASIAAAADPAPLDLAGRTPLPVLVACFRQLDFLLTNDTGPMHLAAAVGTPLLDLCGAADERVTGPRGAGSEVLVHPIHCRPCVKNTCAYNLGCMTGILEEVVLERIRGHLIRSSNPL